MNGLAKMFRGWTLYTDIPSLECPCGERILFVTNYGEYDIPETIDTAWTHAMRRLTEGGCPNGR